MAFALLFTQAVAGLHRHGLVGAEQRECAACVVAHLPGIESAPLPALTPPRIVTDVSPPGAADVSASSAFSYASPLACGPPA